MKKLFWILLASFIIFLIVYGVVAQFRNMVNDGALAIGGQVAVTVGSFWAGVTANPVYQQYHMLIWLFGGVLLTVAVIKLWPRVPRPFTRAPTQPTYQNQPLSTAPQLVQKSTPKTVEKTKAEVPIPPKEIEPEVEA